MIKRKSIGPYTIYERYPKPKGVTKYTVGKQGEAELHDFGRYSVAIRYCKSQMPRAAPYVVINYDDKTVLATMPLNYTIIDGPHRLTSTAIVDPLKIEEILSTTPDKWE